MVVSSSACECFLGTVAHLLIRLAVEPLGCIDFFFFLKMKDLDCLSICSDVTGGVSQVSVYCQLERHI